MVNKGIRRIPGILSALLLLLAAQTAVYAKGYKIAVDINGLKTGDTLYITRYYGEDRYIVDTRIMTDERRAIFKNNKQHLKPGMDSLVCPEREFIDFFVSDSTQVNFTITADMMDLKASLNFKGSDENQDFAVYKRYYDTWTVKQQELRQIASLPDATEAQVEEVTTHKLALKSRWDNLQAKYKNSLLGLFIGNMQVPEIPTVHIPAGVKNHQQYLQNQYYLFIRDHYFDNFDFSNPRILELPLYDSKLSTYFNELLIPLPDSLRNPMENLLAKVKQNDEVYKYTVFFLYDKFKGSTVPGYDVLFINIAQNHILNGRNGLFNRQTIELAKKDLGQAKMNPVGDKTANLLLKNAKNGTISLWAINANYTILYFFSPDCAGCEELTPILRDLYTKYKDKGVEILAVYPDQDKEAWKQYVAKNQHIWPVGWDPEGKAAIYDKYDLYAFPMIYLLDADKNVLAKDLSPLMLKQWLEQKFGQ